MANYQVQRTFFWPFNFLRNVYIIFIHNCPLAVFSKKKKKKKNLLTPPTQIIKKKKEKETTYVV